VTHTYAEPGSYSVALTVEDFYGTTATTSQAVTVAAQSTATPTPTVEPTDATPTSTTSTPGFGIGAALAGVLGGGYLIGEWRQDEDTD
jgi:PGF-CTERM protein